MRDRIVGHGINIRKAFGIITIMFYFPVGRRTELR